MSVLTYKVQETRDDTKEHKILELLEHYFF